MWWFYTTASQMVCLGTWVTIGLLCGSRQCNNSFRPCIFVGILVADSSSDDPELTHMLCESLLISDAQITPEGEEASQSACSRLHQAVDTLLELLNQANKQVRSGN